MIPISEVALQAGRGARHNRGQAEKFKGWTIGQGGEVNKGAAEVVMFNGILIVENGCDFRRAGPEGEVKIMDT